jgi:hypothetical protein
MSQGPTESGILAQIKAPHFTAGIVLMNDAVTIAAPIVKYMVGWNRDKVRGYCQQKRWNISIIQQTRTNHG